jgi:ribose transport system permease protein
LTEQAVIAQKPLTAGAARPPQWRSMIESLIPLTALVLIVIATGICEQVRLHTHDFLSWQAALHILQTQSPVGLIAIGMTFVIISGGIDLSVGSMLAMCAVVGMWTMIDPDPTSLTGQRGSDLHAILIGAPVMVLVGVLAGAINGVLISKGRLAPFIATLGGLAAYRSIARTLGSDSTLNLLSNHYLLVLGRHGIPIPFLKVDGQPLEFHYSSLVFLVASVLAAIVLNRTRFGRYVFAIGGNERAAAYSAINVDRVKILTYTGAGFLVGIAAVLASARQSSISSTQAGQLNELDAIAAVVIGGTRITGGSGGISGTVIGVLILGVIDSMLKFLDVPPALQGLVKGVIIIAAAMVQRVGRRA